MTDRIAQLEKLLDADPKDTFCLYGLAQEHANKGEMDQAIEYYDRTIEVDPDYCYAYFHKAKCLEAADREDAAIETLRTGLERAETVGDQKAAGEIAGYLDALS